MVMAPTLPTMSPPVDRIQRAGAKVQTKSDGSIDILPASGKNVTIGGHLLRNTTGQDMGTGSARWNKLYIIDIDASDLVQGVAISGISYGVFGASAATTGVLRIPNNQFITARNAANTGDMQLIGANSSNQISLPGTVSVGGSILTSTDNAYDIGASGANRPRNAYLAGSVELGGDAVLLRDAANTLALRNGTNPQAFRAYNTFTDTSNYERGGLRWSSNILELFTEAAGTGTARGIAVLSATDRFELVMTGTDALRGLTSTQYYNTDANVAAIVSAQRARGTRSAPAAVQANDSIGAFSFRGHDGSAFAGSARIHAFAAENWTSTAHGTYLDVYTTANGSTTTTARWRVTAAGDFYAVTDNAYDIGASGDNRPRNAYLAGFVQAASELRAAGSGTGVAGHISYTGSENTGVARSTGVGTIKFADTVNRDNAGFIKVMIGTTAYYIPVFTAN